MDQTARSTRRLVVDVVVALVALVVVASAVSAGLAGETASGDDGAVGDASSASGGPQGPLQADNETGTSTAERVVRDLLVKTIAAAEGRMPLVAGQGFDEKVAALEITDSTVAFEQAPGEKTRILVSVTMHNPNAAPIGTPKFAGDLSAEGTVLYEWTGGGTEIRNAPSDGQLDPGETRRLTYVLPIDGLDVQRNIVVLAAQTDQTELEVSYNWHTRFVTDRVVIPGGDGVQCSGDITVSDLSDNVDQAISAVECEKPDAPPERATGPQPDVVVTPSSLSFQDATVDETSTREVVVENTGNATLRVSQTDVAGKRTFDVSGPSSFTLAPGDSRTLTVRFTPRNEKPDSATLQLVSNDPDEPQSTVYLSSSGIEADVSVTQSEQRTDLDAAVKNVTAGEEVSITVPETNATGEAGGTENASVESVSVTTNRDTSFSMNVTASEKPLSTTPEFNVSSRPDDLEFVSVDHSLSNDAIEQASLTYRVNKSTLRKQGSEPDDFQLYRNVDGEWTATETKLVNETGKAYVFRANASGFSEWTAAAQVPRINVSDASANVTAAKTGEAVTIDVLLTNTGGSDGLFVTKLLLNGTVVERREVSVAPNSTSLVTFERSFDNPGDYAVQVNDVFVATVSISGENQSVAVTEYQTEVQAEGADSGSDSGFQASGTGGPFSSPTSLVGLGLVALLVGSGLVMRFRSPGPAGEPPADADVEIDESDEKTPSEGDADEPDGGGPDDADGGKPGSGEGDEQSTDGDESADDEGSETADDGDDEAA